MIFFVDKLIFIQYYSEATLEEVAQNLSSQVFSTSFLVIHNTTASR